MVPPAAPHPAGAVLRVARTAAVRRALRLALLVGGLVVLGFLYGGRAQAAEGAPVPVADGPVTVTVTDAPVTDVPAVVAEATSAVAEAAPGAAPAPRATSTGSASSTTSAASAARGGGADSTPHKHSRRNAPAAPSAAAAPGLRDAVAGVSGAVRQVVVPVAGGLVRPVVEEAVAPVGGVIEAVTGGLGDVTVLLPQVPALPLPLPVASVPLVPVPVTPSEPAAGLVREPPASSAPERAAAERAVAEPRERAEPVVSVAHGPWPGGAEVAALAEAGSAGRAAESAARAGQLPALLPQSPGGDPSGLRGERSAVDNGGPRHGDAHAVPFHHRALPRLAPGAVAECVAVGTRDLDGTVPEPPD